MIKWLSSNSALSCSRLFQTRLFSEPVTAGTPMLWSSPVAVLVARSTMSRRPKLSSKSRAMTKPAVRESAALPLRSRQDSEDNGGAAWTFFRTAARSGVVCGSATSKPNSAVQRPRRLVAPMASRCATCSRMDPQGAPNPITCTFFLSAISKALGEMEAQSSCGASHIDGARLLPRTFWSCLEERVPTRAMALTFAFDRKLPRTWAT
mmetsp:Transcript_38888/g.108194  ORF Transcript_38888/g.108194 Transcript_38888/m.108194 type:complete len:207 (-) Transcript_38888:949-1569(-)